MGTEATTGETATGEETASATASTTARRHLPAGSTEPGEVDGEAVAVRRRDDSSRYEITLDGQVVGFADYVEEGDVVVFPHTVVDPARRGEGLAAILVGGALDDVRATGRRVVPACSYVRQFIDSHPAYQDLLEA